MDRRFVFSVWCVWFSVCGVRLTNCVGRPVNHFDRNIVGCAINVSHGATSTFICVFLPLFFFIHEWISHCPWVWNCGASLLITPLRELLKFEKMYSGK